MSKVTAQIDPSVCILAANCVGIELKLFQIGQEPYVELIDATGISQGPNTRLSLLKQNWR